MGFGVFCDQIAHTSGSATNTAHGLTAEGGRFFAWLVPDITSSNWYTVHPDHTSGYRQIINTSAREATGTEVTVNTTNHTINSSVSTGTYRAVIFAQNAFIHMGIKTGNNSADGPFDNMGGRPSFALYASRDWDEWWKIIDDASDPDNVVQYASSLSYAYAELGPAPYFDICCAGLKSRTADNSFNQGSGRKSIWLSFVTPISQLPTGVPK